MNYPYNLQLKYGEFLRLKSHPEIILEFADNQ